ncbi:MAG: ribosome biogenesis GTPase Der [Bacteroidaceae bacterium]|jgi:GTP-binding protein|nr:ribosome biogenesis GTPase Der [Bacteroidaceae bacterium]MBR5235587.1 ribosome biogenesis GTPase Der [Bacteroidaceae bacterium]
MGNLVAIVGRPNVGKSTLFNRFTQTRHAIVADEAGTTRDRQYGKCEWTGREFSIVDTGGWVVNSDDIFEEEIRKQVLIAVEEADVVLFLVDVQNGVTDLDEQVASILRRSKTPVILVSNKTDNYDLQYNSAEFYSLGLGDPICVSALTGSGTGDLLDMVIDKLPAPTPDEETEEIPRFAVVGRPNVGKSSIVNAFIGEDRNIVTNIAGTTRDSIYTRYTKFGFDFYLVDTAGIRKKGKVNEDLEFYSVMRSIRAIENADVCILMLDATRGIESQDLNIYSLVQRNQKGLVVVINKWDLVEDKSTKAMKYFEDTIRERFAPFVDFPIVFASALTKQRIFKVLELAKQTYLNRTTKVSTAKLNEEMLPIIEATPPPSNKGKYIKIKYCMQLPGTRVPSFVFFANLPQYVKEPYKRFLENKIRERWNFTGTPMNIYIRQK